ncbi:MAG: spore coat protein CotJB [Faecousia sp.]
MNNHDRERNGGEGRLPALAPLANPYVPFQMENPPKYDTRKALVRGTLFPGLDLPFMDMINKSEKPITPSTELQAMAFALQELALYLDTHRDDEEALEMYRAYQQMYHKGRMEYTKMYGPISHDIPTEGPYQWLDDPWPWEFCTNKEG